MKVKKERETLFMMIAYTLTRNLFDRQLHMSTTIKCIKVSIIVFVISITAIINYNLSVMESALIEVGIYYANIVRPSSVLGENINIVITRYNTSTHSHSIASEILVNQSNTSFTDAVTKIL